jgi:curved DNA-binding protein CbpA
MNGGFKETEAPDIIVTNFEILNEDEEKKILNYLKNKTLFIHTGDPSKKPFYSNLCLNPLWKGESLNWFGLKVLNDLYLLKSRQLSGFEEFINSIRNNKCGFFSIKSGLKRVSFILNNEKIVNFSHTENDFQLGNLLLKSNLNFDIEEILKKQYNSGNFFGNILIESSIIDKDILKEKLLLQVEKIASLIAQMKNHEFYYEPINEIQINLNEYVEISFFLNIFLKNLNFFPSQKPIFLLKDTVIKSENFEERKDISLSPTQYYILNEAKNPIEVKKLLYIIPGDEKEKEKDITFLYALSLISVVKEGERLNPFEEVLKLAEKKDTMNFYEILGLNEKATSEEIRKAYFDAAKKYHPDKFSSFPEFFNYRAKLEDFFATINQAYQILSNEEERKKYDLELKGEVKKEFDPKERARILAIEGKNALAAKQYQLAIQKFSEIVYLKQEDWKVLQLLGKAYLEENKLKEAEQALKKSLSLEEKNYETHSLLGDLYLKAGLKARAIKEYQRSLEINPANIEVKEKLDGLL